MRLTGLKLGLRRINFGERMLKAGIHHSRQRSAARGRPDSQTENGAKTQRRKSQAGACDSCSPHDHRSKPATTAQSLGALLKSARDIMRKDKGLNGDLDRLPMLTWIMFLKFLDDLELQREGEAKLAAKKFKPGHRAAVPLARLGGASPTASPGDELLAFINQEECTLPNGKKGAGLFRYLRTLTSSNGDNRRDVIATVFRGVQNRMVSGYLLRDVINKLNGIHFTASDELHTLGALYESMLREMRDAAGDSGEFYTPRAVVRFMVAVTDPRLGETVLDPASGTGGFLVETFKHLRKQVKTVADRKRLAGTLAPRLRTQAAAVFALPDEPAAARARLPADRPRQLPALQAHRHRREGPRGHDPHQPALRRRGGERHPGQFPRGQADCRNRAALSAADHAQAAQGGARCPQRRRG